MRVSGFGRAGARLALAAAFVGLAAVFTILPAQGATPSSANPEVTSLPVFDGTQTFTVKVVPYTPTAETVNVKIELATGSGSGGGGGGGGTTGFGGPTPTQPGVPRYQTLSAPQGSGANA